MKIFGLLFVMLTGVYATMDVHVIAEKIDAFAADQSLSEHLEYKVYDPFKRAKPLLAQKQKVAMKPHHKMFKVETILNNRAWVNGKWVQKGSIINGSKVVAVHKDAIIVRDDDREILIPVSRGKNLLRVKEIKE
jgi:hypothetical protein